MKSWVYFFSSVFDETLSTILLIVKGDCGFHCKREVKCSEIKEGRLL